ncbi:hypothetical protein HDV00_008901 [Rhizophlyctis rosea]|nr:hypothetical protein HDV00_008901 [Rhizophlyctis rosea]
MNPLHHTADHDLSQNWKWKKRNLDIPSVWDERSSFSTTTSHPSRQWTPTTIPSDIHLELLKAGRIPDPFVDFNEHKVQWVGDQDWLYATMFTPSSPAAPHTELIFRGLDTYCTIYLNGTLIAHTSNMFQTYTIPIPNLPNDGSSTLLLHFHSAKKIAKDLEAKYGKVRAGSVNLGDPSRVYVRKAQYHWRWDWGPELMCTGPYRSISFRQYTSRIDGLYPMARVSEDLECALDVDFNVVGSLDAVQKVTYILKDGQGKVIKTANGKEALPFKFSKGEVELWWPVQSGKQTLYDLEVTLHDETGEPLDTHHKRFGFRRIRLIQDPLPHQPGTTFLFEINNRRIFIGGSNWIPADSFLTRATPDRFRTLLQLLVDGNQNMVRVWGGGVYEADEFYDICDELGILVWQDFQFACGVYPAHDEFVASVKQEAECNVVRLRHHPSIVLWCGNNEDYQQVLQWGDVTSLPAVKIYEEILPQVVSRLIDPKAPVPYWPGSPYGGQKCNAENGWDTTDPTVGDIHQWEVWGSAKELYQDWDRLGGRFVSEFGLPSLPTPRTLSTTLPSTTPYKTLHPSHPLLSQHTKAGSQARKFAIYLAENFRPQPTIASHTYITQIMQSDGVSSAFLVWRRNWKGRGGEECGGVLVWQLNDCWPCVSWSLIDYYDRPKPAYWTVKRALRPVSVGVLRTVRKNRPTDRPRQFYEFGGFRSMGASVETWVSSSEVEGRDVRVVIEFRNLQDAEWCIAREMDVSLVGNGCTEILEMDMREPPNKEEENDDANAWGDDRDPPSTRTHTVVCHAVVIDSTTKKVISTHTDWPQPHKYTNFPAPNFTITFDAHSETLAISAERPCKGLVFDLAVREDRRRDDDVDVKWSDNCLDLWPGEEAVVCGEGLAKILKRDGDLRNVRVSWMGMEEGVSLIELLMGNS